MDTRQEVEKMCIRDRVNNMAKYITDTATGYFVGEPIVYDSQNDEYLQTVQDLSLIHIF